MVLDCLFSEIEIKIFRRIYETLGLVGMLNASKVTLLGAISRAKTTIGHYAFTTLWSDVEKSNYDDVSITLVDILGLI